MNKIVKYLYNYTTNWDLWTGTVIPPTSTLKVLKELGPLYPYKDYAIYQIWASENSQGFPNCKKKTRFCPQK